MASAIQIVRSLESIAANHWQRRVLEQPEEFEDDHDNDNHSNYVKDVSVHTGDSYQSESAVARIYLPRQPKVAWQMRVPPISACQASIPLSANRMWRANWLYAGQNYENRNPSPSRAYCNESATRAKMNTKIGENRRPSCP